MRTLLVGFVMLWSAHAAVADPNLCFHRPFSVHFVDVAEEAGIGGDIYHASTHHGLGLVWIDYDRDSHPDLFLVNGYGWAPHLFHNRGDGTFERADSLLPELPPTEMSSVSFADYDNDGDSDIYVSTDSDAFAGIQEVNDPDGFPNLLLQNQFVDNGGRVIENEPLFRDVAREAGVDDRPSEPFGPRGGFRDMAATWLDVDRDGWVDLFCGHWVPNLHPHPGNRDRMYRNRGDGTFEDATEAFGIDPTFDDQLWRAKLTAMGAQLSDDLWPDLFIGADSNGHEIAPRDHARLLLNNGEGRLIDATALSPGVGDDSKAAMGLAVSDIDLDGDWDIVIANQRFLPGSNGNVLYLGNGDGTFADDSSSVAGIRGGYSSWGVNFFDADQDGYEDLYAAEDMERDYFWVNNCDGTFTQNRTPAGFPATARTRGSAVADYDGDGDIDLAFVDNDGSVHLMRNDTVGGHWLRVVLKASQSNRDAIGAVVQATIGDQRLMRQIVGGSSAHSQNELAIHFGTGRATRVAQLLVLWPSGQVTELSDVAADRVAIVSESPPTPTPSDTPAPTATPASTPTATTTPTPTAAASNTPTPPAPTETPSPPPRPTSTPTPTTCGGDCNGDHQVTVDEIIFGVQIALGVTPLSGCPALDVDADGHATVADIVSAVTRALDGCVLRLRSPGT